MCAEVGAFQNHFRSLIKNLPSIRLIVLADNGKRDAALMQSGNFILQFSVNVSGKAAADCQAGNPVLAHHSPPKRVVEIQHEALAGKALSCRAKRGDFGGQQIGEVIGEWAAGHELLLVQARPDRSRLAGQPLRVQNKRLAGFAASLR